MKRPRAASEDHHGNLRAALGATPFSRGARTIPRPRRQLIYGTVRLIERDAEASPVGTRA